MKHKLGFIIAAIIFLGITGILFTNNTSFPFISVIEEEKSSTNNIDQSISLSPKIRTITYSLDDVPNVPDKSIVNSSTLKAFLAWELLNENLKFQHIENDGDIMISWNKFAKETHSGLAIQSELYRGDIIIGLGKNDCNGNYIQSDENSLQNTLMHEIGHILGLDHTLDKTHLMYGDENFTHDNFKNFEYVIPNQLNSFYVGYDNLKKQYDDYQSQIEKLANEYDVLDDNYNSLLKLYQKFPQIIYDDIQYQDSLDVYEKLELAITKLNQNIDKTNNLIDEQNNIVDKMDCFPDIILIQRKTIDTPFNEEKQYTIIIKP